MAAFKNEGISEIVMTIPNIKVFCPLGKAWYSNMFEVFFLPGKIIPDYCDIEKWIAENLVEQTLTIEASVLKFKKYLEESYCPEMLAITSTVTDAAHFEVKVTA